jgi:hemerythrin-like domain-containing protein
MDQKPIKRSKHIVALSKDHHAGLLFSWKIKEGLKRNIELYRIKKYINYFWDHHLKAHFAEEEALLFNQIDDELCEQGKQEHLILVTRLNRLNYYENEDPEEYTLFAELLIKHIRFEERILFPHLETILPLSVLINAGEILDQQHPTPIKDNYADEFWISTDKLN